MSKPNKLATAYSPQILIFLMDDSGSMSDPISASDSRAKCDVATEELTQVIMQLQADSINSNGNRYVVSIAGFGDEPTPLEAVRGPLEIDLNKISFKANGGNTNVVPALEWALEALEASLAVVRHTVPKYSEKRSPSPVIFFFSDGENTDKTGNPAVVAQKIRSVPFEEDEVRVVACGIGLAEQAFELMKKVASREEYAINLQPQDLALFIARAGTSTPAELDQVMKDFKKPGR